MRFRQRHVHETIRKHVLAALTTQGWVTNPVNFGTTPATVIGYMPLEAGETPAFNTVAVSMGDEGAQEDEELGAGLQSVRYIVFVDVFGETEGVGDSIAADIKDSLTNVLIPVLDFSADSDGDVTDETLEFEMVVVEKVATATTTVDKRTWRAVKATALCNFLD